MLASLPQCACARLMAAAEDVELPFGAVLYEDGAPLTSARPLSYELSTLDGEVAAAGDVGLGVDTESTSAVDGVGVGVEDAPESP